MFSEADVAMDDTKGGMCLDNKDLLDKLRLLAERHPGSGCEAALSSHSRTNMKHLIESRGRANAMVFVVEECRDQRPHQCLARFHQS